MTRVLFWCMTSINTLHFSLRSRGVFGVLWVTCLPCCSVTSASHMSHQDGKGPHGTAAASILSIQSVVSARPQRCRVQWFFSSNWILHFWGVKKVPLEKLQRSLVLKNVHMFCFCLVWFLLVWQHQLLNRWQHSEQEAERVELPGFPESQSSLIGDQMLVNDVWTWDQTTKNKISKTTSFSNNI